MNIYALYDNLAKFYEPPICYSSDEEAARSLAHLYVVSKSSPTWIDLYCIGVFDPNNASLLEIPPYKIDNFQFYIKKGLEHEQNN